MQLKSHRRTHQTLYMITMYLSKAYHQAMPSLVITLTLHQTRSDRTGPETCWSLRLLESWSCLKAYHSVQVILRTFLGQFGLVNMFFPGILFNSNLIESGLKDLVLCRLHKKRSLQKLFPLTSQGLVLRSKEVAELCSNQTKLFCWRPILIILLASSSPEDSEVISFQNLPGKIYTTDKNWYFSMQVTRERLLGWLPDT